MLDFRPGYHEWLFIKGNEVFHAMNLDIDIELENADYLEDYINDTIYILNEELKDEEKWNYVIDDENEKEQLRERMRCQLDFLVAA